METKYFFAINLMLSRTLTLHNEEDDFFSNHNGKNIWLFEFVVKV